MMQDLEKNNDRDWINPDEEAEILKRCECLPGFGLTEAKDDFSRFGLMTVWLSGDLPEDAYHSKRLEKFDPQRFSHLFDKVKSRGHIVSFGASNGGEALGMLAVLQEKFGLSDTRFLVTDFSDYADGWSDVTDRLVQGLLDGSRVFYIDPPSDFSHQVSEAYLFTENWRDFHSRIIREYGDDWDATNSNIFKNARKKLDGEIGLMVLRHPEIGDEDNPELSEIFQSVISNLFDEAMSSKTPLLITTSNNQLSRKRINQAVQNKISMVNDFEDNWDYHFGETPGLVQPSLARQKVSGGRIMDSYFFTLIPKSEGQDDQP